MILAIGLGSILAAGTAATVFFSTTQSTVSLTAENERKIFGELGSAHEHSAFIVNLEGTVVDFSIEKYQVKSPFIHVENRVGTTLHRHSTAAPFGEFLKSVGMRIDGGCFVDDNAQRYCDSDDKKLRFFVDGEEYSPGLIQSYIASDNDRFLIIYGNQTPEQLQQELDRLENIPIFRS